MPEGTFCGTIDVVEALRWLRQAEKDLESARDSSNSGHYEWACFQAQQAAEKALKAFLLSKGFRAILSHSIRELLQDCSKYAAGLELFISKGKVLDSYYIPTRYPNGLVGSQIPAEYYSAEDAETCINYAESILSEVKKYLKS